VPFDIPEAESELVAGFMTEYSSLYFSIIVLSEYLSMLVFALLLVLLFNLYMLTSLFLLFSWCTTRATLNRLKYDELLHLGWYMLLLLVFALFMLFLFV
jgi:NADH-quinone oxidoreductase subunit H